MTPEVQKVHDMIARFAQTVGVDPKQAFDPEKKAWYFKRGSARIEVFVQGIPLSNGEMRYFLRIFSPIMKVPAERACEAYKYLLELNDRSLGVKLTLMPDSNQVYATYERDIQGLDPEELSTCMLDLGWWADKLDDELQTTFSDR